MPAHTLLVPDGYAALIFKVGETNVSDRYSSGGYVAGPPQHAQVYQHGDHRSLTSPIDGHCPGGGICDRIVSAEAVAETAKRYVETQAQAAAARIIRNQPDQDDHDTPR